MTETQIVHQVISYMRSVGIFCWRQNTSGIYVQKTHSYRPARVRGLPDILGVMKPSGRLIAVECKRPGGRLAPHQAMMLKDLVDHGALVCVATRYEDVESVLKQSELCATFGIPEMTR